MNLYVYIDESGDTGYTPKSTRFFIVTALYVYDVVAVRRLARDIHKGKRNKNKANQLHAHKESDQTRKKILEKVRKLQIQCIVSIIDKTLIITEDPYLYTLEKIAKYLHTKNISNITLAKRDTRKKYNTNLINLFFTYNISVTLTSPIEEKALQIADFYSWIMFSHLEHDKSYFYNKLQHTITMI